MNHPDVCTSILGCILQNRNYLLTRITKKRTVQSGAKNSVNHIGGIIKKITKTLSHSTETIMTILSNSKNSDMKKIYKIGVSRFSVKNFLYSQYEKTLQGSIGVFEYFPMIVLDCTWMVYTDAKLCFAALALTEY